MTTNYRDTLNLPETQFSMKAGLPQKEPEILNFWHQNDIYKKIREKYSARNPKTGEIIYVPEKNKVRFKASKKLKEFINK